PLAFHAPGASHARHHSRMSRSLGGCTPCSILLTRVKCWPVAAASARAVKPASLRSSRNRMPRASWACLAALYGLVFTVWNGKAPHGFERRAAELEVGRVSGGDPVDRQAVAGVEQEDSQAVVEQVEVVAGEADRRHEPARYPPDVLARRDHGLGDAVRP